MAATAGRTPHRPATGRRQGRANGVGPRLGHDPAPAALLSIALRPFRAGPGPARNGTHALGGGRPVVPSVCCGTGGRPATGPRGATTMFRPMSGADQQAMAGAGQHPQGWYPDPFGRHETRYWDGSRWTEHVASHGRQGVDAPVGGGNIPTVNRATERVAGDVTRAGVQGGQAQGGGTIFTEPILVVNQKAKLIEVNNEYAIYDQHGRQIGAVRQVGQSAAKKVIRVLTSYDQFMTHKLQVVDAYGNVLMALTRPAKVLKSRVIVQDGMGNEVGLIAQQNAIGKIRFSLESGGQQWGSINAENWRAWNFNVQDHTGAEVARITKTWEGLAKTMFTTADNYVVQIHRPLQDPLRTLVVAAALGVDTALKQDARGFG